MPALHEVTELVLRVARVSSGALQGQPFGMYNGRRRNSARTVSAVAAAVSRISAARGVSPLVILASARTVEPAKHKDVVTCR